MRAAYQLVTLPFSILNRRRFSTLLVRSSGRFSDEKPPAPPKEFPPPASPKASDVFSPFGISTCSLRMYSQTSAPLDCETIRVGSPIAAFKSVAGFPFQCCGNPVTIGSVAHPQTASATTNMGMTVAVSSFLATGLFGLFQLIFNSTCENAPINVKHHLASLSSLRAGRCYVQASKASASDARSLRLLLGKLFGRGGRVSRGKSLIKNGARYRVRTCDPFRVKEVLYH